MVNTIFSKNYSLDKIYKYNARSVSHYFLGPIIPHSTWVPNELVNELNNANHFDKSQNPKISELYLMAKLYLIQELVDNIGTSLEIAVGILKEVKKLYDLIMETINIYPNSDLLTPDEVELYVESNYSFTSLYDFLTWVYNGIYIFYLPKLQNDKNNKKPAFRDERFMNKPLYVKFLKLYKSNSLFFDEQTNFMHEVESLENINPYKYKERINIDDIRDIMPGKDKFLSDKKSLTKKNKANNKKNISI